MDKNNDATHIIVVGGGLVGSLCVCFLARRGYKVDLYEYRDDIRQMKSAEGRSINLAMSNRGRRALRYVKLEDKILDGAIPMRGRLIHNVDGEKKSIPYDARTQQCVYSVKRNYLNDVLLTAIEEYPTTKIYFKHKLIGADLEEGSVTFLKLSSKETITVKADLIIGADGAFSALRKVYQQSSVFNFSQRYIEHSYIELNIPSDKGGSMIPNHLHIWPRKEFMLIALPNLDLSWTVTLFMPTTRFEQLSTPSQVLDFFKKTFPDSVDLIGEDEVVSTFFKRKPSPLMYVKCSPYHCNTRFLLIGDAAHAMVPFYGQGMNCGFEDCVILDQLLDMTKGNIGKTVEEFSKRREVDAHAICDLAVYNYVEMRDLVTTRKYLWRKWFDDWMFRTYPGFWVPLYNSVTFSNMDYSRCIENRKWQDKVIRTSLIILGVTLLAVSYTTYTIIQSL